MKYTLPELPYSKDALQPYISAETLDYHHGKHHRAYVDTLNKLISGTEFENMPLEEIILKAKGPIFNNAAQAWNHTFFWNCMIPSNAKAPKAPSGKLADAINKSFGSFQEFREKFSQAAISQFGSGWAWLSRDNAGKISVHSTGNAANPLQENRKPLLTCDVWEHAYYIDYRNARPKFVDAFWNIVNWDFVERNFML